MYGGTVLQADGNQVPVFSAPAEPDSHAVRLFCITIQKAWRHTHVH